MISNTFSLYNLNEFLNMGSSFLHFMGKQLRIEKRFEKKTQNQAKFERKLYRGCWLCKLQTFDIKRADHLYPLHTSHTPLITFLSV